MGLEIMGYRAGIINASLDIQPGSRKGTVVTCVFFDTDQGLEMHAAASSHRSIEPLNTGKSLSS
jgi:hypothetical protein